MTTPAPVLIVDGNPHMTAMLQRFLTQHQVNSQTVLSAAEARALLAQHAFRAVVTDRFGPSDEGLALLRYVRQTVPTTPVILMTTFGAPDLHQHALTAGAYACLAKPFRLQELWDIMQPALQSQPAPETRRHYAQGRIEQPSGEEKSPGIMPGPEGGAT
jgi:two-component system, NtrC family, response regulator PilR